MQAVAFVGVQRFAAIIGISDRQVWRLVRDGSIPSLKLGRRRLIPLADAIAAVRDPDRHGEDWEAGDGA